MIKWFALTSNANASTDPKIHRGPFTAVLSLIIDNLGNDLQNIFHWTNPLPMVAYKEKPYVKDNGNFSRGLCDIIQNVKNVEMAKLKLL